jgi:hypothetical protein
MASPQVYRACLARCSNFAGLATELTNPKRSASLQESTTSWVISGRLRTITAPV